MAMDSNSFSNSFFFSLFLPDVRVCMWPYRNYSGIRDVSSFSVVIPSLEASGSLDWQGCVDVFWRMPCFLNLLFHLNVWLPSSPAQLAFENSLFSESLTGIFPECAIHFCQFEWDNCWIKILTITGFTSHFLIGQQVSPSFLKWKVKVPFVSLTGGVEKITCVNRQEDSTLCLACTRGSLVLACIVSLPECLCSLLHIWSTLRTDVRNIWAASR